MLAVEPSHRDAESAAVTAAAAAASPSRLKPCLGAAAESNLLQLSATLMSLHAHKRLAIFASVNCFSSSCTGHQLGGGYYRVDPIKGRPQQAGRHPGLQPRPRPGHGARFSEGRFDLFILVATMSINWMLVVRAPAPCQAALWAGSSVRGCQLLSGIFEARSCYVPAAATPYKTRDNQRWNRNPVHVCQFDNQSKGCEHPAGGRRRPPARCKCHERQHPGGGRPAPLQAQQLAGKHRSIGIAKQNPLRSGKINHPGTAIACSTHAPLRLVCITHS